VSDGFEDDVHTVSAGQVAHRGDALLAASGDDVGGAKFRTEIGAFLVAAHQNDLFGTKSFRG
jgi:hypothetical protein